jgi:FMN phosphatase YigB (HAD superfamily)
MIRAVIFDCFGVLTSDGWLPFKRKHFGHDGDLHEAATELNKRVDAGLSDYGQFLRDVAELAQVPYDVAKQAIENNVADDELFGYIANELKPKYKLGLLSNAGDNWLSELFKPEQVGLFDAVSLSYQSGHIKPKPDAYRGIADQLGVLPQECVFIDDQERFCSGARDVGMQAILYQNLEQCKRDLAHVLEAQQAASTT